MERCGVKAGDDEIEAHVVILADGVNSLLAKQLGMTQKLILTLWR